METMVSTEKVTKVVTTEELRNILFTLDKGTFVQMETITKLRMNKGGRENSNTYYDKVFKHTTQKCLLGNDYGTRVQNKTDDPDFVPQPCKVGEHLTKCVLYNENTEKYYLQYEWFDKVPPKSELLFDGVVVSDDMYKEFETYIVKSSSNKFGIYFPSVTIDNIISLSLQKVHYKVVNP